MSEQRRVPPGSPEGGQWAPDARAESEVSLSSLVAPDSDMKTMPFDHLDLESIPDLDGTPFREVLERQFAPLTDYEAEHGPFVPPRELTAGQAYQRAGLQEVDFGRERRTWISTEGEKPYLCVETANGYDDGSCTEGSSCGECSHCLNEEIAQAPGFAFTETDGHRAFHHFDLPSVSDDEMISGDPKSQLARLAQRRDDIASGKIVPWSMSPVHNERLGIRNSNQGQTYKNEGWSTSPQRQAESAIDHAQERCEALTQRINDLQSALDGAQPVLQAPPARTRAKIGARGQKLQSREPIPVRYLDVAQRDLAKYRQELENEQIVNADLEKLADAPNISPATRDYLQHEIQFRRTFTAGSAQRRRERQEELEWEVATATAQAPALIESLKAQRTQDENEIAQLTEGLKRAADRNWHRWPGESYDDYRAWMEAHSARTTSA